MPRRARANVSNSKGATGASLGITRFDFESLQRPGIILLKFVGGYFGSPHERLFVLSNDLRYLSWESGWFCRKRGKTCVVPLEKVLQFFPGQTTSQFQRWSRIYGEAKDTSFSIIYTDGNGKEKTLSVTAPTYDIYNLLFNGLQEAVQKLKDLTASYSQDTLYMKSLWDRADSDHNGTLDLQEIVQLLVSANINIPFATVKKLMKIVDMNHSECLDFQEFIELMNIIRKRGDLECLWTMIVEGTACCPATERLPIPVIVGAAHSDADAPEEEKENSSRDQVVDADRFASYWLQLQGESLTAEEVKTLFTPPKKSPENNSKSTGKPRTGLGSRSRSDSETMSGDMSALKKDSEATSTDPFAISYGMFRTLMDSPQVSLFDPKKSVEYQDMKQPLSHYYMASSHNTYLEGDQLTSNSSVNRYISDLRQGCRCVELDCWDGDNGQPIIYHGGTLTSKIIFKDVIEAIMKYAFEYSLYPVVLSIENHCCLNQQKIMAKIMREIFGSALALPIGDETKHANCMLPSPADLKGKILIKGKRPNPKKEAADEEEEEDVMVEDEDDGPISEVSSKNSRKSQSAKDKDLISKSIPIHHKKKAHKVSTHADLAAITYLGTGKVKDFLPATSDSIPCDVMASYSEITTLKNLKDSNKSSGWIMHNSRHLSRIYPKGTRVDSSNYSPVAAWACGNQLVAMNYQTGDLPYQINFGKFLENGRCGYILKPEYMRNIHTPKPPVQPVRLVLNILSGNCLPKPGGAQKGEIIDPYVHVWIHDPFPSEMDVMDAKTHTVQDNGFNPVWNETFVFTIRNPDLSYITFYAMDEDLTGSDFLAFNSMPVSCMLPGMRYIQLYNELGKKDEDFKNASLFVRVFFEPLHL